jgi:hypothetical protein
VKGTTLRSVTLLFVLCTVAGIAQTVTFIYVESFRKGSTRVMESTFEVALDPQNPTCRIRVKDQSGRDRYELACAPQRVGAGDERIVSWQVRLEDLHHKIYPNVLMSATDASEDKTQIGWFDPGKFAKIPLTTERVIKVDSFYCVLQAKDHHFVTQEQPYLDRMTLDIHFTNTMPHMRVLPKEEKTGA